MPSRVRVFNSRAHSRSSCFLQSRETDSSLIRIAEFYVSFLYFTHLHFVINVSLVRIERKFIVLVSAYIIMFPIVGCFSVSLSRFAIPSLWRPPRFPRGVAAPRAGTPREAGGCVNCCTIAQTFQSQQESPRRCRRIATCRARRVVGSSDIPSSRSPTNRGDLTNEADKTVHASSRNSRGINKRFPAG